MSVFELILIALALSMDAFAVAVSKGLSMDKATMKAALTVGIYFGLFQAVMPLIGYYLGFLFADLIRSFDHWIAFVLLVLIGGKMIFESFSKDKQPADAKDAASLKFWSMLPLAIATSIDALATGVTFAFLEVRIFVAVALIGLITFALSFVGVKLGNLAGAKYKAPAEFAGGVILVLMGLKILLEHLGVIAF